jgi:hypothetical protein
LIAVDNRDLFHPNGSGKLCEIISHYFPSSMEDSELSQKFEVLKSGYKCSKVMEKSENNKGTFADLTTASL